MPNNGLRCDPAHNAADHPSRLQVIIHINYPVVMLIQRRCVVKYGYNGHPDRATTWPSGSPSTMKLDTRTGLEPARLSPSLCFADRDINQFCYLVILIGGEGGIRTGFVAFAVRWLAVCLTRLNLVSVPSMHHLPHETDY